jgi:hypothetical protein
MENVHLHTAERYIVGSCHEIAYDIATLLYSEGRNPAILRFTGNGSFLFPRRYGGRVRFGAHLVASAQGVAFDPLLAAPVTLEEYSEKAFGVQAIGRVSDDEHCGLIDRLKNRELRYFSTYELF